MDDLIGSRGKPIADGSIIGRLSRERQEAIDAKMVEWFGHDSELGAYSAEDVRELGKHAI